MPVVLRVRGFRFEFYASDGDEPPHIHVKRNRKHAKLWLMPAVTLAFSTRFAPHEINQARRIVVEHQQQILEAWRAFFGG